MRTLLSLLCLLILITSPASLRAQSEAGAAAVEGTVRDPAGDLLPSATVRLRNVATGLSRTVTTDANGRFYAPALPTGEYVVEATAPGFPATVFSGLRVGVGRTESVRLQLVQLDQDPPPPAEPLPGVADERLDVEEPAGATTIETRAVMNLPVRGRQFVDFVQLTPTATRELDREAIVIAGQRSINTNFALDGVDFNDALQGSQRGGNQSVFFFPQAAVQEFQVVRSGANPEVGRTTAGFVNVVTRSGTNELHGELFYLNRNGTLTAADAFGRRLSGWRNQQFGGSVGGRIIRDRSFFFVAAEQAFQNVPFVVQFQQQAPGTVVPADLLALQGPQRGTNNPTALFARYDTVVNRNHALHVHYTFNRFRGENFDFVSPQIDRAATSNYTARVGSHAAKLGLTSTLAPRVVNELRGQFATDFRDEVSNSRFAQVEIAGFGRLGGEATRPRLFESYRYQLMDNVSVNAGAHRLRFGGDLNINDETQRWGWLAQGRYDYLSLADFVAGRIARYRQLLPASTGDDLTFRGTQREFAVYAHDSIVLSRDLTLSAGVRWEGLWNPQPTRPNPALPQTTRIPNDLGQWQPRVGLVYSPGQRDRTVVRVSAGLFAARTPGTLFGRVFTENGLNNTAVDSVFDPAILTILQPPAALTGVPAGIRVAAPRVFGFAGDFRNPRSFQGAATVEHQFGNALTISAGYLRVATWNLQRRLDRNLSAPAIDATGLPVFNGPRPIAGIGRFSVNESSAHATYDAMILTASRRLSRRVQFQGSYTLSRNVDDDTNERHYVRDNALNPFDLSLERGYSTLDARHLASASGVVDLPYGVLFSATTIARSGLPYTPVVGFDTQRDGNDDNDRAIINGRVAERNSFRQPSFYSLDLRLQKGFSLGENRSLNVLAEGFNVTRASNRNFGPDSVSAFGTAARPVATAGQALFAPSVARFGGPRQLQLGLRLLF